MLKNLPIATRTLILANVGIFILTSLLYELDVINFSKIFSSYYPESSQFSWYQPLTHMFLHADLGHLFFNMLALLIFGATVESHLGTKRFLFLYFIAGIGSFILFNIQSYFTIEALKEAVNNIPSPENLNIPNIVNDSITRDIMGNFSALSYHNTISAVSDLIQAYITPMMGASGAIYGVLVAFGFLFPNAGLSLIFVPYPIKAKYFIPGLIILEIILGLMNLSWNPVAHFAHIGGAVAGFLLVFYWKKQGVIR
ncbi:rhomboid family intramembrane serine protease [Ignatzschineria sp. LJL83]